MVVIGAMVPTLEIGEKIVGIGLELGVEVHACVGETMNALPLA